MRSKNESPNTAKKLIEVAIELFSSGGFRGTSIRDIAKATGMTLSNIYYYFGSKDGLLLNILVHSSQDILDRLHKVSECDMEPLERFKLLLRTHLNLVKFHKREAKIFFLDEENLSPEGNKVNKQFQVDILSIYRKHLGMLHKLGYTNYPHLTILALNILGVINWHLRWYRPEGPIPLEDLTEEIMNFILHGVLCNPSKRKIDVTSVENPSTF